MVEERNEKRIFQSSSFLMVIPMRSQWTLICDFLLSSNRHQTQVCSINQLIVFFCRKMFSVQSVFGDLYMESALRRNHYLSHNSLQHKSSITAIVCLVEHFCVSYKKKWYSIISMHVPVETLCIACHSFFYKIAVIKCRMHAIQYNLSFSCETRSTCETR